MSPRISGRGSILRFSISTSHTPISRFSDTCVPWYTTPSQKGDSPHCLQQMCTIPLKEVHKFFGILVFQSEFLVIGKDQNNPFFIRFTSSFRPFYYTHVYNT